MKLKPTEITKAIIAYARKNNMHISTVRTISAHRYAAIKEYKKGLE